MKCKSCSVKIDMRTSAPVSVRHSNGQLSGPYCERCAERECARPRKSDGRKEAA